MNDHLLQEMVRIRMDELQAEASRARAAREVRRSHGWRLHLGMLAGGFSRGRVEEACCA